MAAHVAPISSQSFSWISGYLVEFEEGEGPRVCGDFV